MTLAYVSIRQHASACVSLRQHTAKLLMCDLCELCPLLCIVFPCVCVCVCVCVYIYITAAPYQGGVWKVHVELEKKKSRSYLQELSLSSAVHLYCICIAAPYEGGVWKVHVELPVNYPYKSPSIGYVSMRQHVSDYVSIQRSISMS